MRHFFICKDDVLGFAVLLTRGRSENKGCDQQQKQGRAKESNPEVGIVHVKSPSQSQPASATGADQWSRLMCPLADMRAENLAFNTTV
jgi:hypothetical protein